VVIGNGSVRVPGDARGCEALYCEEPAEGGRPSMLRGGEPGGMPRRAGDGPRALDRYGSPASSLEGEGEPTDMPGCACGGVLPARGDARYVDGGVPTRNGSDCADESESLLDSSYCAWSCNVFPSSALILCLTRLVSESDRDGSPCR
jgi:hypothetical protein